MSQRDPIARELARAGRLIPAIDEAKTAVADRAEEAERHGPPTDPEAHRELRELASTMATMDGMVRVAECAGHPERVLPFVGMVQAYARVRVDPAGFKARAIQSLGVDALCSFLARHHGPRGPRKVGSR